MSSMNPLNPSVDPSVAAVRAVRPVASPTGSGNVATPAPATSQAATERSAAVSTGARAAPEAVPASAAAVAVVAPSAAAAGEPVTRDALQKQVNALLAATPTALQFRVDDEVGRLVVSVVDEESGDVLLQIPGEVALRIAKSLANNGRGLVNEKA